MPSRPPWSKLGAMCMFPGCKNTKLFSDEAKYLKHINEHGLDSSQAPGTGKAETDTASDEVVRLQKQEAHQKQQQQAQLKQQQAQLKQQQQAQAQVKQQQQAQLKQQQQLRQQEQEQEQEQE